MYIYIFTRKCWKLEDKKCVRKCAPFKMRVSTEHNGAALLGWVCDTQLWVVNNA